MFKYIKTGLLRVTQAFVSLVIAICLLVAFAGQPWYWLIILIACLTSANFAFALVHGLVDTVNNALKDVNLIIDAIDDLEEEKEDIKEEEDVK